MKKIIFAFTLLISVLNAQTKENINQSDSNAIFPVIWNDISLSVDNELTFFKRPFSFDSKDLLITGGIVTSTAVLFLADKSIRNTVQKNITDTQNNIVIPGYYYGNGYVPFGLGAGIYFGGLILKNNQIRETGSTLLQALVASGITVTVLKVLIGRARPYSNKGPYSFNFFELETVLKSLPSGHAILAFTTSTVLAEKIDNIYASIGLYGLASLTAYQRIYDDKHWLSDVFLGSVLGIVIGKYFVDLNENISNKIKSKISYNLFPVFNKHSTGFGISITF